MAYAFLNLLEFMYMITLMLTRLDILMIDYRVLCISWSQPHVTNVAILTRSKNQTQRVKIIHVLPIINEIKEYNIHEYYLNLTILIILIK